MRVIPVIDLKDGQVVHAVRGARDNYQPIHYSSRLTESSDIHIVLTRFLELYPFDCFYIADIDAICGKGDHKNLIARVIEQNRHIEFWIDNGSQLSEITANHPNMKSVIGTESQKYPPKAVFSEYILSLDFNQQALGAQEWFSSNYYWPNDVIVMTLARVGSNSGPDFYKLKQLLALHPGKRFVAAGGVRHYRDLQQLAKMRISSVLVASALHSGIITGNDIAELQTKKYPGKPGYFRYSIAKT